MKNYKDNIFKAAEGEIAKAFGAGQKGMTLKKKRLMKLVRYFSRSIHGYKLVTAPSENSFKNALT